MPAIVPIAIIGLVGGVLSGLFGIGGGARDRAGAHPRGGLMPPPTTETNTR